MNEQLSKPKSGSLPHHQKNCSEMSAKGFRSEFCTPPFKTKTKDNAEVSLYLDELEKNYCLTNTIHPRFYNVNLIELARKEERQQNGENDKGTINDISLKKMDKVEKSDNYQKNGKNIRTGIFQQRNLLGESQYISKEEEKTDETEICFTTLNELVQNKEKTCTETKFLEKKTDSEGNKVINQYTIMQQLGKYSKK